MEVFFDLIKETPLPTLLVVIGIFALSIGFGLKFKAAIDVESVNRTYAKTIGVILLLLGLTPYVSDISLTVNIDQPGNSDPFLIYYMVSVPIIVVFFGAVSKYTSGQNQIRALKISFIFIATIISFVVFWRAIDIYFFISSSGALGAPMGFYSSRNFLPYLILLSVGVGAIVWFLYLNTRQSENNKNRIQLFQYFSVFCVYLAVCRLGWEVVDYIARMKVPAP